MKCVAPLYRFEYSPDNLRAMKEGFAYLKDLHKSRNGAIFINAEELDAIPDIYHWRFQGIRCGQCAFCRLAHSQEWAYRCLIEAQQYEHNYFVTLTYNDTFLPGYRGGINPETGETFTSELRRSDVTKFIKRLRSYCKYHFNHTGVRVFYSGEYGSINQRPHYHLILFNMPQLTDLKVHTVNKGVPLYVSDTIQRCWSDGFDELGFCTVGDVTFDSAAYVARYCMKKQTGKDDVVNAPYYRPKARFYAKLAYYNVLPVKKSPKRFTRFPGYFRGRTKEFVGMSNRPGIAASFLDANRDEIFKRDQFIVGTRDKVVALKPFRYYEKRYDVDINASWYLEDLKESRRLNGIARVRSVNYSTERSEALFLERKFLSKQKARSL